MPTYWDATDHARSLLAELVFAEALFRLDSATVMHSPRHPLTDVQNAKLGLDVDVKVATQVLQTISERGPEPCVEWWGGNRAEEAREGATHFALVVLDKSAALRFEDTDASSEMRFAGTVKAEAIYLVERELVNTSKRRWNQSKGREGTSVYRHLPLAVCEARSFPDSFAINADGIPFSLAAPAELLAPS